MDVRALPLLSCSLCCTNTICADNCAANRRSAANKQKPTKKLIGAADTPRFAYRRGEWCPASPISEGRIAAPLI